MPAVPTRADAHTRSTDYSAGAVGLQTMTYRPAERSQSTLSNSGSRELASTSDITSCRSTSQQILGPPTIVGPRHCCRMNETTGRTATPKACRARHSILLVHISGWTWTILVPTSLASACYRLKQDCMHSDRSCVCTCPLLLVPGFLWRRALAGHSIGVICSRLMVHFLVIELMQLMQD